MDRKAKARLSPFWRTAQSLPGLFGAVDQTLVTLSHLMATMSSQQLAGPFTAVSINVGVAVANFGAQVSYGGGVWQVSITPPVVSLGIGAAGSKVREAASLREREHRQRLKQASLSGSADRACGT